MIRTFDGLEVEAIEIIPAVNAASEAIDYAHGGYWNCELTGGGCVQQFGDELMVRPDAQLIPFVPAA